MVEDRAKCIIDEDHEGIDSISNNFALTIVSMVTAFIASLTQIKYFINMNKVYNTMKENYQNNVEKALGALDTEEESGAVVPGDRPRALSNNEESRATMLD